MASASCPHAVAQASRRPKKTSAWGVCTKPRAWTTCLNRKLDISMSWGLDEIDFCITPGGREKFTRFTRSRERSEQENYCEFAGFASLIPTKSSRKSRPRYFKTHYSPAIYAKYSKIILPVRKLFVLLHPIFESRKTILGNRNFNFQFSIFNLDGGRSSAG